jgi:hypothetical protein
MPRPSCGPLSVFHDSAYVRACVRASVCMWGRLQGAILGYESGLQLQLQLSIRLSWLVKGIAPVASTARSPPSRCEHGCACHPTACGLAAAGVTEPTHAYDGSPVPFSPRRSP